MALKRRAAWVVVASLAGGACTAMSTIKTADTVPAGQNQFVGAFEANGGAPLELPVKPLLPEFVFGVRRGLTDRLDVGVKLTTLPLGHRITTAGLEGQVKVQLRRVPGSRYKLALGPAAGFRWISSAGAAMQVSYLTIPFITGIDVGRHQIVVAPEAGVQLWTSAGANEVWAPMLGLSLGFVWRINPHFALVPEVAAYRSTVRIDYSEGSQMFHIGIGCLF